jgi:outer membrane lipoprotein-sorting protein
MKKILTLAFFATTFFTFSQNVDEIIDTYYKTIGGSNWDAVKGMRMIANVDNGGMKIPVEVISLRDGRTYTKITFGGNDMYMGVFDGKTSWSTNFMTMEAEESTADDSENARRSSKEFPNALVNYKNLGYSASLIGNETVDGTDCFKIKLEKKTMLVEGKEVPNIEYYYFDKDNFIPIMVETEINSGEMKGQISQTKLSDYQEVNGVFLPFSTTSGMKDGQSQTIQFDKIEINPAVDESKFAFPKK